ncbi:MAG: sodium:solute symporter, partial [Candidatus Latescibacterota bacterium]|nr:sodium:solute symporter [Candidatus Latescibacterota bacterium]
MIIAGLVVYLAIMLAIGLYASRRVEGSADFVVAGRRLGIWLSTGTLAATWFGGGLCIGAASAAYSGGFLAVIADPFGAALCLFLAGLFYVRALRRTGVMTVASFFTHRFSRSSGLLASVCTIPAYVGWVASLMVAFGRILQSLAGVEPTTAILLGAAVVLVYTFAGGMWAVTLTDFVQLTILIVGMVVLTPILLSDMGGWSAIAAQIPTERFFLY